MQATRSKSVSNSQVIIQDENKKKLDKCFVVD